MYVAGAAFLSAGFVDCSKSRLAEQRNVGFRWGKSIVPIDSAEHFREKIEQRLRQSERSRDSSLTAVSDTNFVLYVSNQSYEDEFIRIQVSIDGKLVIDREFFVYNQHTHVEYAFHLTKGKHKLLIRASDADVTSERQIEIVTQHWAAVSYWHDKRTPRQFGFDLKAEKIYFH